MCIKLFCSEYNLSKLVVSSVQWLISRKRSVEVSIESKRDAEYDMLKYCVASKGRGLGSEPWMCVSVAVARFEFDKSYSF